MPILIVTSCWLRSGETTLERWGNYLFLFYLRGPWSGAEKSTPDRSKTNDSILMAQWQSQLSLAGGDWERKATCAAPAEGCRGTPQGCVAGYILTCSCSSDRCPKALSASPELSLLTAMDNPSPCTGNSAAIHQVISQLWLLVREILLGMLYPLTTPTGHLIYSFQLSARREEGTQPQQAGEMLLPPPCGKAARIACFPLSVGPWWLRSAGL